MQHVPAREALTTFELEVHADYACHGVAQGANERELAMALRLEDARTEAYKRGWVDCEAELSQKCESVREELKQEFEHELASLADTKARNFEALSQRVDEAISALSDSLSQKIAAILTPVLDQAASQQVAEELLEIIQSFRAGPGDSVIRIIGPSRLIESLGGKEESRVRAIEDETMTDIVIAADETRIESELSRWQARLWERVT